MAFVERGAGTDVQKVIGGVRERIKGGSMPTYISLFRFTEKGVADIKHGPDRLAAAKQRARERGGEIKAFYLTMGQYDAVAIIEAPNDQTAVTGLLQGAAQGYIRTETLRAFTEDEYKKIVAALP